MSGIFISYRREDSGPYSGRLYDMLAAHFGEDRVFFDIDTIAPGEDFREAIEKTWATCRVLLVVIGKQWATSVDKNGNLRINKENDLVRLEIATALKMGLRVIPVLAGGADMPEESILPHDIKSLTYRNAWDVSDKHFRQDVLSLVQAIEKTLSITLPKPEAEPSAKPEVKPRAKPEVRPKAKTTPAPPPKATAAPRKSPLFPLFGITPDKTPVKELATLGKRSKVKNVSTNEPYNYYEVNSVNFWYDAHSQIVNSVYLVRDDNWPQQWIDAGFRPEKSYDQWIALLQANDYELTVVIKPHTRLYEGHLSLKAELVASYNYANKHWIKLDFANGKGTTRTSADTLSSFDLTTYKPN
jgi:hypothetical protein